MFLFLNRLMKALVIGLWIGAGAWVWSQREIGRPLLDYYQVWHECGYQEPPPLPRLEGSVERVLAPSTVIFRDTGGATFSIGLVGWVGPDPAKTAPKAMKAWSTSMVAVLSPRWVGQPAHVAYTSLQTNWAGYPRAPYRTGTGYLYLGTNEVNVSAELLAEGRIELTPQALQLLPLREQVAFRVASRQAAARRASAGVEPREPGIAPTAFGDPGSQGGRQL